jgi:hypothetical protein
MNKLSKVVMLAATVVTMGSLAACQSTTNAEPPRASYDGWRSSRQTFYETS